MVRLAFLEPLPFLRASMPQADRGEGALDGIGRPQVAPVLSGEVVEGQEDVAVLREAVARPLVLRTVLLQEVVEGFGRRIPGLGEPDLVKVALRLRLESLRHLVEHVGRLVTPAPKDSPVNGTSATVFRLTDCS